MRSFLTIHCTVFLLLSSVADASSREPLLVPGKTTLYQRVISHPGTFAYSAPNSGTARAVHAFTPFYVYGRQIVGGEEWLEVSPASSATSTQWIKGMSSSRWDKALSLMFADRMGRDPVMFFRSYDGLNKLITSENLSADLDMMIGEYQNKAVSSSSPLIALEPKDAAIPRDQFYLMPIFDYSLEYEQFGLKMLKIGCINPGSKKLSDAPVMPSAATPRKFKSGVAFIVDTTISMKPYIEKTKGLIRPAPQAVSLPSFR